MNDGVQRHPGTTLEDRDLPAVAQHETLFEARTAGPSGR
jgi:hypothetical protein